MVKGISRRVIVVDAPDTRLFEQAIFIVRNDIPDAEGVSAQELVNEACRVARGCMRTHPSPVMLCRRSSALWCAFGAACVSLAWLLWSVL